MALAGQILAQGQAPVHAAIGDLCAPGVGEVWLLLSAEFYNSGAGDNVLRIYLTKSGGTRRQVWQATLAAGDSVVFPDAKRVLKNGDTMNWSADNATEVNGTVTGFIRT